MSAASQFDGMTTAFVKFTRNAWHSADGVRHQHLFHVEVSVMAPIAPIDLDELQAHCLTVWSDLQTRGKANDYGLQQVDDLAKHMARRLANALQHEVMVGVSEEDERGFRALTSPEFSLNADEQAIGLSFKRPQRVIETEADRFGNDHPFLLEDQCDADD